jgi:predicted nucleic-acid-binding protein
MKGKGKGGILFLLGLLAAILISNQSKAQKPISPNQNPNKPDPNPNNPNTHPIDELSGRQEIPTEIPYPTKIEKLTDSEIGEIQGWNFGFIQKTQNRWFGEIVSNTNSKGFINRFAGIAAVMYLLHNYITKRNRNTIEAIAQAWSVNPARFIRKVSEYSGFLPNQTLRADTAFLFPLAYAIALYFNPKARFYLSQSVFVASLDVLSKYYKINLE